MLKRVFLDHPQSVGETYFEHMREALGFASGMAGAALACLTHAFIPCLFTKTASAKISRLHERMVLNRSRVAKASHSTALLSERTLG